MMPDLIASARVEQAVNPLVIGNWKMNGNLGQLRQFCHELLQKKLPASVDAVICPPPPFLLAAAAFSPVAKIGAQDCHSELSGAFTGGVSARHLAEVGASYVIVGHSERRLCGESDSMVAAKAAAAISAGLTAVICVGETNEERGMARQRVGDQLRQSLPEIATSDTVAIAYEPVWAIGSGNVPEPQEIEGMHDFIRSILGDLYGSSNGPAFRILYGGSVNVTNAEWICRLPNVDGLLVGGSSLNASQFVSIAKIAARAIEGGESH